MCKWKFDHKIRYLDFATCEGVNTILTTPYQFSLHPVLKYFMMSVSIPSIFVMNYSGIRRAEEKFYT